MTINFSAPLANYTAIRYPVIRNLEEPGGVVSRDVYTDSVGFATIGAGFKVDSQTTAILRNMLSLSGTQLSNANPRGQSRLIFYR